MASSLRSLLLLAALALAMSPVLCARFGLRERPRPRPPPPPTPAPTLDVNDVDVQRMLHFAMLEYNMMSTEKHLSRPLRVLNARKETVAATNYFLEVEIGKTTCAKDNATKYSWFRCPFDEQKDEIRCRFMVDKRPWLSTSTKKDTNCHYT